MPEVIRVRCPCCGMTPRLNQLPEVDKQPAEVRVFTQKFGGKVKVEQVAGEYKKVGRGKAPGLMVWEEITGQMDSSQLETIKAWFVKRAKAFLEKN
jgi:hypothetical protein